MKITALLENTTKRPDMSTEHGLSLYIETAGHKILFDMGQTELFSENAAALGIDLEAVDLAVLSHGHYDHGGGLATLYAHNSKLLVTVGQNVNAGDIVSLSGSTGRSTGPHLHFEVRVNGERVNPRSYLP